MGQFESGLGIFSGGGRNPFKMNAFQIVKSTACLFLTFWGYKYSALSLHSITDDLIICSRPEVCLPILTSIPMASYPQDLTSAEISIISDGIISKREIWVTGWWTPSVTLFSIPFCMLKIFHNKLKFLNVLKQEPFQWIIQRASTVG